MIGQTLSHYRITAALGVGGMGEVYRATDTSLGREVAIKVLPPEVAKDPERLARFRREAHLLAALNHPHIAAIYGLEEADGKPFLVLELVEGEDLKQRLERGPLPVDEALEIARQVAEALEEAHNKGIIHRDLKPANVKLTADARVKVLDFGLAKAWAGAASDAPSGSSALSQSPTLAHTGTVAGVILGTAAYMSPEQARGKPVDKRADVWSFGVLLWEVLTGRALFAGHTVTDVIAAVVTREPDPDALPPGTPPTIRRLLLRCLRKDPRTRLPDIGTARLELSEALGGVAYPELPAEAPDTAARKERRARARERWAWAALALALGGLATVLLWERQDAAPERKPAVHFVVDTPEDVTFPDYGPPAISPDGRHVAFAALSPDGGTRMIWIRPLDSTEARPLAGTEGASVPFWSPDGTSLAFGAGGELRKLVLAGGATQRVCALPHPAYSGGDWSRAGTIVLSCGGGSGTLFHVPAAGGEASALTSLDTSRGETGHFWPQFLPDGRLLFHVAGRQEANAGLFVTTLERPHEKRRILAETTRFVYASPGQLLTVREGVLTARPFDARRLLAAGESVPLASNVATWAIIPGWGWFSASATGRLAWFSERESESQLTWFDRIGKPLGRLGEPANYGQLALSPDARRVAVEIEDAEGRLDLWLIDTRGVASRLTTDPTDERDPVWSPDGTRLAFTSDAGGDQDIVVKALAGSQPAVSLPGGMGATPGERDIAENWSASGNTLLYMTVGQDRTFWALPMEGKGEAERLMSGKFNLDEPHVSPDGRWLAYVSTESGRFEVYAEPFRRPGEKVRVSTNGGGQPRWRGDGKELFYLSLDGGIVAVTVREAMARLELGIPTTLVPRERLQAVVQDADYDDWDVTPDGQRFLVKLPARKKRQQIHVLLDWESLVAR